MKAWLKGSTYINFNIPNPLLWLIILFLGFMFIKALF